MSDVLDAELKSLHEQVGKLEERFAKVAEALNASDPATGPRVMAEVFRAVLRTAGATKRIQQACPTCSRPDAKKKYVAVNKLSGVWQLDDCPTCKDLNAAIHAFERAAGISTTGGNH